MTDPQGFTEKYAYEPTGEVKQVLDKLLRSTTWTHDHLGRIAAMTDTLGRLQPQTYSVPTSGAWTGPSLMVGSADASAPPTSLSTSLRNGDYQIGKNAFPIDGYPAQISVYRDATFQLGFTHLFDGGKRPTQKKDRNAFAIDDATVATPSSTSTFWNELYGWNPSTPQPVFRALSTGDASLNFTRNFEFDITQSDGFGASTDPTTEERFTRDPGGRVTRLERWFFGVANPPAQVSTYTYRSDGRLAQVVNQDGTHDFTYDSRGLLETQTVSGEGTYRYGYDEMGRNAYLEYPDGHVRRQHYDELGRFTSRCYEYGSEVRCYTAQYDAVGNPVRMTDPDGTDTLEYDALDRLKKVTRDVGGSIVSVEDYDYNAIGALKLNAGISLDHQRPRLDGAGLADAAVPNSIGGQSIVLEASGRVTSLRGNTFTWLKDGSLRQIQPPAPAVAERYAVDAERRRTATIQGNNVEFYVYEGLDRIATIDATGAVRNSYLFNGIDHPLRIRQGSTTAYYELDLAGNVRALRGSGGADLGAYRYSAFGRTVEETAALQQPLRWKGRWFSPAAGGIYDVRARQWAPELGVFLSVDDYEYHDEKSTLWAWPNQSPSRFSDPTGRQACPPPPPRDPDRLKKCKRAANGSSDWDNFCRSLPDPALRAQCWEKSMTSDQEKKNWCEWHFG